MISRGYSYGTICVQQQYPEVSGFSTISCPFSRWAALAPTISPNGVAASLRISHPSIPSVWCWFEARDVLGMICVGATRGFSALTKKLRRVAFMSFRGDIKLLVPGIWDLAFSRISLATIVANPSGGDKNKHSKYCHNGWRRRTQGEGKSPCCLVGLETGSRVQCFNHFAPSNAPTLLGPSLPPTNNLKGCDSYEDLGGSKAIHLHL